MNYKDMLEEKYPEGSVQGQCGTFCHQLMQFPLVGDTIQSKTAAVKKYGYTAAMVQGGYCAGDVLIIKAGANGHVAFCNTLDNGIMTLSESNWNLDKKVHHTRQVSVHDPTIVGCLRGKLLFLPPNFTHRVLVLLSNIPDSVLPQLKQGIQNYVDKVTVRTTGLFNIVVDLSVTTASFTVINQTDTIYVQPADVAFEGHKVELANNTEYDVVCLIYDNSQMVPKPNHPIEAPLYLNGFNVIEIPLDWISSLNDPSIPLEIYPQSTEIFFAHELSHADYYLVNKRGGYNLFDHTHDDQILGFPSPMDYYLMYLINLKPFWSFLVTV